MHFLLRIWSDQLGTFNFCLIDSRWFNAVKSLLEASSISPDCEPVFNHLFYVFKDQATIHWTGHPTKSGIASEMEPRYLTAKEPMTQINDKNDD